MALVQVDFSQPDPSAPASPAPGQSSADALGSMLHAKWVDWEAARREQEERWLYCLRAFNQTPDTEAPKEEQESIHAKQYFGLTRTKVITAFSRIVDLMFQASDKHWGISATPVPKLDAMLRMQIKQRLLAAGVTFLAPEYMDELLAEMVAEEKKQIATEAETRAKAMEEVMDDQLVTIGYEDATKFAIFESALLGTGVVEGIIPGVRTREAWQRGPAGWDLVGIDEPAPQGDKVSIFDVYPDPYAKGASDCTGAFRRHVMTRAQLSELKKDPRFNAAVIDELLATGSGKGMHTPLMHETERRKLAGFTDSVSTSGRYDVFSYWGCVDGHLLEAAGVRLEDGRDPLSSIYWANVWHCGGRTILARTSPLKRQTVPYHFFPFFKDGVGLWGTSPGWMMRHSQKALNSLIINVLDNADIASGPQAEISVAALKDQKDLKLKRWKTWLRDFGDPAIPAVRFFQPQMIDLQREIDMFRKMADEETSLPSYTHGEELPGLNDTATGMSMLMTAANVTIKSVVKNLEDGMIRPLLTALYDWNMEWNTDESIKGDAEVIVRGSSALIAKEVQSQRLVQFAAMTANPIDLQYVDRGQLLREIAESMDLNPDRIFYDTDGQIPGIGGTGVVLAPGISTSGESGGESAREASGNTGLVSGPGGAASSAGGAGVPGVGAVAA